MREPLGTHAEGAAWLRQVLHDLSQPLTALECRLYIGTLEQQGDGRDTALLRETVHESLVQCQRLIGMVCEIQEQIARAH